MPTSHYHLCGANKNSPYAPVWSVGVKILLDFGQSCHACKRAESETAPPYSAGLFFVFKLFSPYMYSRFWRMPFKRSNLPRNMSLLLAYKSLATCIKRCTGQLQRVGKAFKLCGFSVSNLLMADKLRTT